MRPSEEEIIKDYAGYFSNSPVTGIFPIYLFEKEKALQHIIHSIKYEQNITLAKFMGRKMGNILIAENDSLKFDFIIPVPLHILKKSERGFNQSEYICKGISKILKTKLNKKIKRVRFTQSQTKLNRIERAQNIEAAFKTNYNFTGKNILLVDDVITTGATIIECAKALKSVGATNIYACSIARA